MSDTSVENEDLLKLAIGAKRVRGRRLNRALLARLIGERNELEGEEDESDDEFAEGGSGKERQIMKLLIGSRLLKRRRLRNLLLAHLLRERSESEDEEGEGEEEDEGEEFAEGGAGKERQIMKLLIGSRLLRRRRLRNLLLAHILRERGESEDEESESDEESGEEGSEKDRRILKLLIASRILKRRRMRKLLIAHLLGERGEAEEEGEDEDIDDESGEEGGSKEQKLMRLLAGKRVIRQRRARKALLAHLLREREEA